jgi:demethylmenaquinone methyltransferase/2-methoxy-6-polyprenyl-1,4-benzoquinol methylase
VSKLATAFSSPEQKQRYVRALFATIADRYDFITVVLSFGRDRAWKRRLIREARLSCGEHVVDLACGTGDIAFEACRVGASATGFDVTLRMVEIARAKAGLAKLKGIWPVPRFAVGDMMELPLAAATADVVTTGYGLRNVPQLEPAIDEIFRVLKPGGRLLSLDFNRPACRWLRAIYLGYLTVVGSILGWMLHRDPDTYRYIPESVRRYPGADGVAVLLRQHGFSTVHIVPILGGLMTLHVAARDIDTTTRRHQMT